MQRPSSFTMDNGMRFIVAEDHASPVAAVGLWVRAGVCEEPASRRGIAHFFEHMMFRGSENFPAEEHPRIVKRMGGTFNASTSFDCTFYWETFPSGRLEDVFRLEADRFIRLRVTGEHTDVERKVILEELQVYENQPASRAMRLLIAQIAGDHPYAVDPLGKREDLEAVGPEDLEEYRRALYRPGNCFCVVSGDVDPRTVRELAERHFGEWTPGDGPGADRAGRFRIRTGYLRAKLSLEVPVAARVHAVGPSSDEDMAGLEMLSAVLSRGESSPLTEGLVKRRRLCVHAQGMLHRFSRGGAMAFMGAFLPPGSHAKRREIIRGLCERIATDGPAEEEFVRHLKRFRSARAHDCYSPRGRLLGLGASEFYEGGWEKYEDRLGELESVTPERIRALASRLFDPENTLELDVVPERTKWWMPLAGLAMRIWPR